MADEKNKIVYPKSDEIDKDNLVLVTFSYIGKSKSKDSKTYSAYVTPAIAEMYKKKMGRKGCNVVSVGNSKPAKKETPKEAPKNDG